ncbi:MAG: GTPase ObgE [Candidatus Paraimprobicoccus trichonymphae]|uniref:GTPase Obg n=1 Tax=Candidatus Paraimprobicoccus trichonymphae TaxID=3033793 RepID=A0AA48I3E2_9FIRM|nr:MAG: GTPase ObgE [Candidatus Paraimprobicoccus trichonymphae]
MFVDNVRIYVKAGDGGLGAVSFHRDKSTAYGGPDGGNGGNGGNVIFRADNNLSTLSDFRYKKKFIAQNGENGESAKKAGKRGEDLVIKVPIGTLIKNQKTGNLIFDISDFENYILAKGGRGGFGNMNFANSVRQSPRFAKSNTKGEEFDLTLELKLLADVGIIGYPNVGKSTFISIVSNAKPEIANYHFTTLSPKLGVVKNGDKSFVLADIPGLIKGAWEGLGLGHEFLKHIERCRLLLHVLDISESENRDFIEDFETINLELKKFNKSLLNLPMIVLGNKLDMSSEEKINKFRNYMKIKNYDFFEISAINKTNLKLVLNKISELLNNLPNIKIFDPDIEDFKRFENSDGKIEIIKKGTIYEINSERLYKLINSINFDDYDSMNYFQNTIVKFGVSDMLKKSGAKNGDTIKINDIEFEYFE